MRLLPGVFRCMDTRQAFSIYHGRNHPFSDGTAEASIDATPGSVVGPCSVCFSSPARLIIMIAQFAAHLHLRPFLLSPMTAIDAFSLPSDLEQARIKGLPSTAYYIPNFISSEEEQLILDKVRPHPSDCSSPCPQYFFCATHVVSRVDSLYT